MEREAPSRVAQLAGLGGLPPLLRRNHLRLAWRPLAQVNSSRLEVSYVTLRNSPFWTIHPAFCSDVHVHHVTILNPGDSPQTDGIDPDSSERLRFHHNHISTGDDCDSAR